MGLITNFNRNNLLPDKLIVSSINLIYNFILFINYEK